MKVTFMIGNGFDLRMGMKTRYVDMYENYVASGSNDNVIRGFKQILKSDRNNKYKNWSDFEAAMAQYAACFDNEADFIKCVRDFKSHMVEHLKKEEEAFIKYLEDTEGNYEICDRVMREALGSFYKGQVPNVINEIERLNKNNTFDYEYISFNYTKVLDYLVDRYERYHRIMLKKQPIHIHGKLESDVVLGIDNTMQLGNLNYAITRKLERAFIKPRFNAEFDNFRVTRAEQVIDESDVICIYGMSLGMSDKTWIDKIANWLLADKNHHLIYFQYGEDTYNEWNSDEKMDAEDEKKRNLLERLFDREEDADYVYDRVHIPVGFDIFDIKVRLEAANKKKVTM